MTIFCAHHKTGSTFLKKVLSDITVRNRLKLQILDYTFKDISEVDSEADFLMLTHATNEQVLTLKEILPSKKIVHFIRNPRKLVLSAYIYHLKGKEKWLHDKNEQYPNSYLYELKNRSREEGLIFELKNISYWNIVNMIAIQESNELETFKLEEISYDTSLHSAHKMADLMGLQGVPLLNAIITISKNSLWFGDNIKLPHVTSGTNQNLEEEWTDKLETTFNNFFENRDGILNY